MNLNPTPDSITLDGRDYLAYSFCDALDLAMLSTINDDSRNVIATLRYVDLAHYTPDPTNDMDYGPDQDKGIDWSNVEFYITDDDNGDNSTADLAAIFLKDDDTFVQSFGANLSVFTQHHLFPTTQQDARIVVRKDGSADFDDIDLNNILTWR